MNIEVKIENEIKIAVLSSDDPIVTDPQSALDLLMTVKYETGAERLVLNKEALAEDFFLLSTGLAGEVLQKFVNYHCKFAVYGDFSHYTSKPLKDFIYESNKGNNVYFAASLDEALRHISTQM